MLPDLSKKQELKWFSNNDEGIMPEHVHNTNVGFDLRYLRKNAIKLKPYLCTCINIKIALEISTTTMVQLASKSSLVKKEINIKGGIIDARYVRNIIAILQNDFEKTYTIEPNEKIAQQYSSQLVSMGSREKLEIMAREINGFGSISRIDIPINMAEKEVIDKGKIISIYQSISIPLYDQYILAIKRKVKDQNQIFEAEATLCESEKIGLVNFYIPAKNYSHIKILIYNNMGNIIEILEGTIIGYISTKIEDQAPSSIPDFLQLCGYIDIILQIIYGQNKYYLLQPEQLEQMNIENLDPL
ncbi:hypothetical protein G9A89_015771 [Geosiphon pyriformis]|nr:hypothetical protein G9A89_015771 [Geosiphon pyriformis]